MLAVLMYVHTAVVEVGAQSESLKLNHISCTTVLLYTAVYLSFQFHSRFRFSSRVAVCSLANYKPYIHSCVLLHCTTTITTYALTWYQLPTKYHALRHIAHKFAHGDHTNYSCNVITISLTRLSTYLRLTRAPNSQFTVRLQLYTDCQVSRYRSSRPLATCQEAR